MNPVAITRPFGLSFALYFPWAHSRLFACPYRYREQQRHTGLRDPVHPLGSRIPDRVTGQLVGSALPPAAYLGAAVGLSVFSLDFGEDGPLGEDSRFADNGHFFAFFFGGKLRVSESFYLSIQPGLTLATIGEKEILGFRVGTGFSGTF